MSAPTPLLALLRGGGRLGPLAAGVGMNTSMDFVVDTTLPERVVIGATGFIGLAQEVRTVLTTRKGSVPLDRDFGLDWAIIDTPIHQAQPRYVAEVARQVEKYVPRVRVLEVRFKASPESVQDGVLRPVVRVCIRKEYIHEFF